MDVNSLIGAGCAIAALLLVWRIYRSDPRKDILPPPSKDVERHRDAGWWS